MVSPYSSADRYKKCLKDYGEITTLMTSPYNLSQDLILIGFNDRVILGKITIDKEIGLEIVADFKHPARTTSISFSQETSLNVLPYLVLFATASDDFNIRVVNGDVNTYTIQVLKGHKNYINDLKFDPENNYLVSTGDDNTVRIWETTEYQCISTLRLTSPGMSVCWHNEDNSKLLVAEKLGIIHFYNVETLAPILSLDYDGPLTSAHWAPSDSQIVASLNRGEIVYWHLAKPWMPASATLASINYGGVLKFNANGDYVAVLNHLQGDLKIISTHNQQVKLIAPYTIGSNNICWHYRSPVLCVSDSNTLYFWRIK